MPYLGYRLSPQAREALLRAFPPKYKDVIAHHVTSNPGVKIGTQTPQPEKVEVIGHADDGEGVQAAVVRVGGRTHREDGRRYHITISIDRARGRKPAHSNDIVNKDFTEVEPFEIEAHPHLFESVADALIHEVLIQHPKLNPSRVGPKMPNDPHPQPHNCTHRRFGTRHGNSQPEVIVGSNGATGLRLRRRQAGAK